MKTCNICKLEKNLAEFGKYKRSKDGLQSRCKVCDSKSSAKYYQKNKEKICKNKAKWQQENKEKMAKYRQEHKEKIKKRTAKYRKENPEKCRAICRKRRALKKEIQENYTKEDEAFTRTLFNNECFNCQTTEELEIDHHYPLSRGHPLTRLNAVVLCRSCNAKKYTKLPEEFYQEATLNRLNNLLLGVIGNKYGTNSNDR